MSKSILIVLAYNEARNIKNTIEELIESFDKVLVINDKSTDETLKILNELEKKYPKIKTISNFKNLGAGGSFQTAIDEIKTYDIENIIKVDGDGQFSRKDILKIKTILENEKVEYVKSNRFWENGIDGKIPTIRYFGNSIANIMIKFNTGQFLIGDPLNGLFGFKYNVIKDINIPKIFSRYGYPFYLNTIMVEKNYLITEIRNKVMYDIGEKSQLKAVPLFCRLLFYSIKYFYKNLTIKLKNSNLQLSAILDFVFIFFQFVSFFCIFKLIEIRYLNISGVQTNWLILFVIFQIFSLSLINRSKLIENDYKKSFFVKLKD